MFLNWNKGQLQSVSQIVREMLQQLILVRDFVRIFFVAYSNQKMNVRQKDFQKHSILMSQAHQHLPKDMRMFSPSQILCHFLPFKQQNNNKQSQLVMIFDFRRTHNVKVVCIIRFLYCPLVTFYNHDHTLLTDKKISLEKRRMPQVQSSTLIRCCTQRLGQTMLFTYIYT